ncbi:hypothetical protein QZH41_008893 [Actinostola sp. cb2023]|nr:hypothetical protein QZH41_008893 [Actinostola sp. cb2023]
MAEESSGRELQPDSSSEDQIPKYLDFPPEEDDYGETDRGDCIRTVVSFFGVALILHTLFSVIMAGSQDLLGGTKIPTTAVLVSHMGPMMLVMYTFPWFMQKISYFIRVLAIFTFMASGFIVIAFVQNPYAKLVGVALNAVAHSMGEATFLALGAFYGELSVTSFAAGSGVGILVGPLYYLNQDYDL